MLPYMVHVTPLQTLRKLLEALCRMTFSVTDVCIASHLVERGKDKTVKEEYKPKAVHPYHDSEGTYRIAGKFGGELNLVVWQIDRPTAKLKSANIKSYWILVGVVSGLWQLFSAICACAESG